MESRVLFWCIIILQVATLVKLASLLISHRRSGKNVFPSRLAQWRQVAQMYCLSQSADSRSELELDQKRCAWTRILWRAVLGFCLLRLFGRQVRLLRAGRTDDVRGVLDQTGSESDLVTVMIATLSLLITCFPYLINDKNQDFWYLLTTLSLSAGHLIPQDVDVADMIGFTSTGLFVYAVLAKRTWCVVLCTAINFLTAIQISRTQTNPPPAAYAVETLPFTYVLSFLGNLFVRRLFRENVFLKVDLQKHAVELGAVSALFTACYDAVLELDHSLRLTSDSSQLSAMLHSPRTEGLSGKPLQDFFSENDRARISEQFQRSADENLSVVVFNADMLDSDFNRVKVELFCAQFKNLAEEQCFLVAVREIQEEPRAQALMVSDQSLVMSQDKQDIQPEKPAQDHTESSDLDLSVVYDAFTFQVHVMGAKMEQLWKAYCGDVMPDNILDLASAASRADLSNQLQVLANQFVPQQAQGVSVKFNLLGPCEVTAMVTIEHDQVLDTWVGTMTLNDSPAVALTKSNLQILRSGHSFNLRRPSRRSRSHRSRSGSRSSPSHGSPPSASEHSGAISKLRRKAIQL